MNIYTPRNLNEALQFMAEYGSEACLLAGGTDVVVKFKEGLLGCKYACNIYALNELRFIKEQEDSLSIGPLITHGELVRSSEIIRWLPILAQAAKKVGSPQIRNRGTIGGNLGTASPAGDTLPALIVLGAMLKLKSATGGTRVVPVREFFTGPGRTVLKPDEIITEITVPKLKENETGFFSKMGLRNSLAISVVNVASKVELKDNSFTKVEIALGSVAPTVIYKRLESLENRDFTSQKLWRELEGVKDIISPISDVRGSADYRKEITVALLYQGLRRIKAKIK